MVLQGESADPVTLVPLFVEENEWPCCFVPDGSGQSVCWGNFALAIGIALQTFSWDPTEASSGGR